MENQSKSWFAILSFCATVAMVAVFALGILVASATIAFALSTRLKPPAAEKDDSVIAAQISPLPEVKDEKLSQITHNPGPRVRAKAHRARHAR